MSGIETNDLSLALLYFSLECTYSLTSIQAFFPTHKIGRLDYSRYVREETADQGRCNDVCYPQISTGFIFAEGVG